MKLSRGQTSAGPSALHLTSFDLHGPSMVHHAMKHMLWYAMIKIVVFRLPLHGLHGFHERSSNGFTPYNMLRLNDAKAGESSGESSTRIQFWVLTQTENTVHCHISSSLVRVDDICESCIWATEYTFWPGTGCPCTSRFPGQRSCFLYSHKYAWWYHSATSEMPLRLKNWEYRVLIPRFYGFTMFQINNIYIYTIIMSSGQRLLLKILIEGWFRTCWEWAVINNPLVTFFCCRQHPNEWRIRTINVE